jgi:hypothetical protein
MKFAPYNELDIDLKKLEDKNNVKKCLSDRPIGDFTDKKKLNKKIKFLNIKCNNTEKDEKKINDYKKKSNEYYNNTDTEYILDNTVHKVGKCGDELLNDKIKALNNEDETGELLFNTDN